MNNKKAVCILFVILMLLLLGGCGSKSSKKATSNSNNSNEEATIVIKSSEKAATVETGDFVDNTTKRQIKTKGKVLGGSETLAVIHPSENKVDVISEESGEIDWLPGIW